MNRMLKSEVGRDRFTSNVVKEDSRPSEQVKKRALKEEAVKKKKEEEESAAEANMEISSDSEEEKFDRKGGLRVNHLGMILEANKKNADEDSLDYFLSSESSEDSDDEYNSRLEKIAKGAEH